MFELPLSGWYWQMTRADDKPEVRTSRSLWDRQACRELDDDSATQTSTGSRQGYVQGPEDQKLRLLERPIDLGDDGRFTVAVAGDALEIDEEVRGFDRALFLTFAALAVGLLLTTMFQVRFGLGAAEADFRGAGGDPLAAAPSGSKASFRSRSRRLRARPMR